MADGEGYTFGQAGGAGGGELDASNADRIIPAFLGGGSGSDDGGSGERDSAGELFDPAVHAGADKRNADGRFTRKRGRRGDGSSGSRNTKAQNNAGIAALTNALAIVHLGIASATKTPELALADAEAETLAKAVSDVLTEFDIRPDPKVQAVFGLVVAAGTIYGPKVYFIRERWKEEAKASDNAEA